MQGEHSTCYTITMALELWYYFTCCWHIILYFHNFCLLNPRYFTQCMFTSLCFHCFSSHRKKYCFSYFFLIIYISILKLKWITILIIIFHVLRITCDCSVIFLPIDTLTQAIYICNIWFLTTCSSSYWPKVKIDTLIWRTVPLSIFKPDQSLCLIWVHQEPLALIGLFFFSLHLRTWFYWVNNYSPQRIATTACLK